MRVVEIAACFSLALASTGCPGTIEDPSIFQEVGQAAWRDSSTEDAAGSLSPEAGAPDAGGSDSDAAGQEAGAEEDGGEWSLDGGTLADGGAEAESGQAARDADIGCDFEALIAARCGRGGCHSAPVVSNSLDLTSDDLASRLAGVRGSLSCSNYLLIDPEQPNRSALYLKVTADSCGSRMPLGGTLTTGEQACILAWLESLGG